MIDFLDQLDEERVTALHTLLHRSEAHDGVAPLNEAALLALQGGPDPEPGHQHFVFRSDGAIVGYAAVHDGVGQLVVDPAHRRRGVATALVGAAQAQTWWSFGALPCTARWADKLGLELVRELRKLGRSLPMDTPARPMPPGIVVRGFSDDDVAEFLRVNAAAFAHHREQGALDEADFALLRGQRWFDPDGLLLAVLGDHPSQIRGFHWTKIEPENPQRGEVYVLGVDPAAGGQGLGGALLDAGLASLSQRGATTVELYVDGDNPSALALYEKAGFTTISRDVMYAAPTTPPVGEPLA